MDQMNIPIQTDDIASAFSKLIGEERCAHFIGEVFERKFHHFQSAAFEKDCLDLEDFYKILLNGIWSYGDFSVVPNNFHKTDPVLTNKMLSERGQLSLDNLRAIRKSKATIRVTSIDRLNQRMRDLCFQVGKSGHFQVTANAYYTPAFAQGFLPHWDTHDVFILQFAGTKNWHIADTSSIHAPLEIPEHKDKAARPINCNCELRLAEGELLYIPRGFAHYATAGETDSLHVTLGIKAIPWIAVFQDLIDQLALENDGFRESLLFAVLHHGTGSMSLGAFAKRMLVDAVNEADLDSLMDKKIKDRANRAHKRHGEIFGSDLNDLLPKE